MDKQTKAALIFKLTYSAAIEFVLAQAGRSSCEAHYMRYREAIKEAELPETSVEAIAQRFEELQKGDAPQYLVTNELRDGAYLAACEILGLEPAESFVKKTGRRKLFA